MVAGWRSVRHPAAICPLLAGSCHAYQEYPARARRRPARSDPRPPRRLRRRADLRGQRPVDLQQRLRGRGKSHRHLHALRRADLGRHRPGEHGDAERHLLSRKERHPHRDERRPAGRHHQRRPHAPLRHQRPGESDAGERTHRLRRTGGPHHREPSRGPHRLRGRLDRPEDPEPGRPRLARDPGREQPARRPRERDVPRRHAGDSLRRRRPADGGRVRPEQLRAAGNLPDLRFPLLQRGDRRRYRRDISPPERSADLRRVEPRRHRLGVPLRARDDPGHALHRRVHQRRPALRDDRPRGRGGVRPGRALGAGSRGLRCRDLSQYRRVLHGGRLHLHDPLGLEQGRHPCDRRQRPGQPHEPRPHFGLGLHPLERGGGRLRLHEHGPHGDLRARVYRGHRFRAARRHLRVQQLVHGGARGAHLHRLGGGGPHGGRLERPGESDPPR